MYNSLFFLLQGFFVSLIFCFINGEVREGCIDFYNFSAKSFFCNNGKIMVKYVSQSIRLHS